MALPGGHPPRGGGPGTGSASPRTRKLPVPEVTGLGRATAEKVLASAGFQDVRTRFVEAYERADVVVGQQPERGALHESDEPVWIHVAKASLLRYLPGAYQPREPGDRAFLRDFLWIFQHLQDGVARKVEGVNDLFNPWTTPPEFLPWLASWFAIAFDESMPEARRRRVLKEAAVLYRIRGTREALSRMVKLFTDLDVEIEENRWPYRGFRVGVSSAVGVDTMILPEISMSHTFVVRVPRPFDQIGEDVLVRLHQVISAEKPANTNYFLQFTGEEGVSEYAGFLQIGLGAIGMPTPPAPL